MPINKPNGSRLLVVGLLLISSTTYASVVGTHTSKGTLNVTFNKPLTSPVKTVATSEETWIFNSDKTFSRGTLTGNWKLKRGGTVEATYNRNSYIQHLNSFWADQGVIASNIRILENKVLVRKVSNGLSIEEALTYRMNVSEQGGSKPVLVSITGSFVALDGGGDNPALTTIFPTMWEGQAANAASFSVTTHFDAPTISVIDSDSEGTVNP